MRNAFIMFFMPWFLARNCYISEKDFILCCLQAIAIFLVFMSFFGQHWAWYNSLSLYFIGPVLCLVIGSFISMFSAIWRELKISDKLEWTYQKLDQN